MLYRKFGRTDLQTSVLGFGCMRLPVVASPDPNSDVGDIDEAEATRMIRRGIDAGINYVDTAYPYHGGYSEVLVGRALQDGYRERVALATKLPIWAIEQHEDFDRILDEQLEKLQTSFIEVYLVHALNKDNWKKAKEQRVFDFLERAVAAGKVKHVGFSFHDELGLFKEIVDAYAWDVCQIQLNYMDADYQAGVEGLRYAADKGLAVVIMEPLRGGKIVGDVPAEVRGIFSEAVSGRTPTEWAFRWVYDFPETATVLSGMSTMAQVEENLEIANRGEPNSITTVEKQAIERVREFYLSRTRVNCTDCKYCLPCPSGVMIPNVFSLFNNASIYDAFDESRRGYQHMVKNNQDASQCVECGQCEAACPQNLEIIQDLKDAHEALFSGA